MGRLNFRIDAPLLHFTVYTTFADALRCCIEGG